MNKEKQLEKEKLENAKRMIEKKNRKELENRTKAHIELIFCFTYLGKISKKYTSETAKGYINLLITHFKYIPDMYEKYFYVPIYDKKSVDFNKNTIGFHLKHELESVELLLTHLKAIKNIEPDNASFMEEIINKIEGTYNKWKEELKDDLENIFDPEDILRRDSNGN